MIECETRQGTRVYVTAVEDPDPETGGWFCRIFTDPALQREEDCMCISADGWEGCTLGDIVQDMVWEYCDL